MDFGVKTILTIYLFSGCIYSSESSFSWYKDPCKQNDPKFNECILKTSRNAIPALKNGDPKKRLPSINPFELPEMNIRTGSEQVGLKLKMKQLKIYGIGDVEILGVRGNLKDRKFVWDVMCKNIDLNGDYEAGGKILVLPITGKGRFDFNLRGIKAHLTESYNLVKKHDGKEYLNYTKIDFKIDDIKHAKYQLENLFNGDKLLGEQMSVFLNENWKDVFAEVQPGIEETMSEVIKFFVMPLTKVPFNDIFPSS